MLLTTCTLAVTYFRWDIGSVADLVPVHRRFGIFRGGHLRFISVRLARKLFRQSDRLGSVPYVLKDDNVVNNVHGKHDRGSVWSLDRRGRGFISVDDSRRDSGLLLLS